MPSEASLLEGKLYSVSKIDIYSGKARRRRKILRFWTFKMSVLQGKIDKIGTRFPIFFWRLRDVDCVNPAFRRGGSGGGVSRLPP